jgi:LysR family carnitine catabolism transcriptional activator
MVGQGLGVTMLPALSLHGLDLAKCRVLRLRERFERQIVVARLSDRSPSPATTAFLQFLRKSMPQASG